MRRVAMIACVVLVAIGACSSSRPVATGSSSPLTNTAVAAPSREPQPKTANQQLAELAERACKCVEERVFDGAPGSQSACADKVVEDLAAFAAKHKDARGDVKKAEADGMRMARCLVNAGAKPTAIKDALKPMTGE